MGKAGLLIAILMTTFGTLDASAQSAPPDATHMNADQIVQSLIPKAKEGKKGDEEQEDAPNLPPDQTKFDEKGKGGKRTQIKADPIKMADIWMRNIQTTHADFLRRRFAVQAAEDCPR